MHQSVLLQESVDALITKADGFYVDGTFGRGGHSRAILSSLGDNGRLLGFDKDPQAVEYAVAEITDDRFELWHGSFAEMRQEVEARGRLGQLNGILLDLGVSSPQLDQADRGFSFMNDGPLDMRMDTSAGETAAEWLNRADQRDIRYVLKVYGEEKFAGLIAKKIVDRRDQQPFERTLDLADFIEQIIPKSVKLKKHAATRSFQAIRIHINQELNDLERLLSDVVDMLAPGGRLVVISFHSLEDRIVKQFIRAQERGPVIPRNIPISTIARDPHLVSVGKAVKAADAEVSENVRSRSAIMRIAEKVLGND
ncbi:Ribosomal RNA small subunit methyltransferase H [BD1-7 clade bacterium]|uniref:Ribosomal RNA small subunit methyltransferase H n=1 Tax=BD1-7 clade bacterium TaxID=2029982 RepID=A0A5S9QAY9_9GAMM|nr:Ribosomal RNA small subunit methyltransferase H [BD1-7 clade bacterium]CAA0115316.1 Ribosomal RNA small subunit methyltransferase H [BD1-7 clade bacterium]